jgi:hypothetical protein
MGATAAMAETMAGTDMQLTASRSSAASSHRTSGRTRSSAGADRLSVALFSVTAFLVVLAVLASQLPAAKHAGSGPEHVLRKLYRTTVIETIAGGTGPSGTSVSQSVSSSGAAGSAPAPTTRPS